MKKLLTIVALFIGSIGVAQEVYIPNTFTPNGDGLNDIFKPVFEDTLKVQDYNLEIYDKSGVQVFHSRNPNIGWDGLPFDTVYVYKIFMRFEGCDEVIIKTGSINLIH